MTIIERISALFEDDDARIEELSRRVTAARAELTAARELVGLESLAVEEGDRDAPKRKQKAQASLETKAARVQDLEAAIAALKSRKARKLSEAMAEAEAKDKEAKQAEFEAAKTAVRLHVTEVDRMLDALVEETLKAIRAMEAFVKLGGINRNDLINATQTLPFVFYYRFRFLPGMKGSAFLRDVHARWTRHVKGVEG